VRTIDCWAGMQPYGIVPLTSEPDGLKYRIVCDVTAKGKQLVEKALGVIEIQLEPNWDYGTNDEPHIGCVLLSPELLSIIGVYALLDDGCHEVWMTKSYGLVGIQHGDSQQTVESLQWRYANDLVQRFIYPETSGSLNPCFLA
jgi:hypothetical protein